MWCCFLIRSVHVDLYTTAVTPVAVMCFLSLFSWSFIVYLQRMLSQHDLMSVFVS